MKIQPRKSAKSNMKNPRNQYGFKMPCSRTQAANRNYVCTACGYKIKENKLQGTLISLNISFMYGRTMTKISSPVQAAYVIHVKKLLYELQKEKVISETVVKLNLTNV